MKRSKSITRRGISRFFALLAFPLLFVSCEGGSVREVSEEFFFSVSGMTFTVGDDSDRVLEALGEPNRSISSVSCAGVGQDELYIYNGFKLTCYREGGKAEITSIELTNDTVETMEGAYIGGSAEMLKRIYGEGEEFSGGVEYIGENCRLRFYIKDGKVVGVKYCGIN